MTTLVRRLSAVTAGWMLAALAACGGGGGGGGGGVAETAAPAPAAASGAGAVEGVVLASLDSSPIAGATVSTAGRSATTDTTGRFRLEDVLAGRAVLRVQAAEFADGFLPVSVAADQTAPAQARLVRETAALTVDPQAAATISVEGSSAALDLPAGSLVVAATGAAPSGPVTARLTPIDPAADPQSMPGGFVADGDVPIESFGAMSIVLQDGDGNRIALRSGATAVVRIPLASRNMAAPSSVPLFFLDEATGRWVEQGAATMRQEGDQLFFEGPIDRLAVWNVDKPLDTVLLKGCVSDAGGQAVANAVVTASGVDYSGTGTVVSDAQGRFTVGVGRGGRATVQAESATAASSAIGAGPSSTDFEREACLVLEHDIPAPTIVEQPADTTTWDGIPAHFSVVASGGRALAYQWQRNGEDISGATYSWLTVPGSIADAGARYRVVVSNAAGAVTSGEATLSLAASVDADKREHLRLMFRLFNFMDVATAPFALLDMEDRFIDPASACHSGSVVATLDGAPLVPGQASPLIGVVAAAFDNCVGLHGRIYSGSSSVDFEFNDSQDLGRITVTADNMRVRDEVDTNGIVDDITTHGSASATSEETRAGASKTWVMTVTPSSGSTLRHEASGLTATFLSGSIGTTAVNVGDGPNERTVEVVATYNFVRFTVDGVQYVATGSWRHADSNAYSGELVLSSNGRRVGRMYGTESGFFIEADGVSQPLGRAVPRLKAY